MLFPLARFHSTWPWELAGCHVVGSLKFMVQSPAVNLLWHYIFRLTLKKKGGTVAYVDAEHALDPQYAKRLGVNIDELLISQPDTGEQALDIVQTLVQTGAVDLVVIDSVAALTPRAEIEGEMGASHMGLQARLILRRYAN